MGFDRSSHQLLWNLKINAPLLYFYHQYRGSLQAIGWQSISCENPHWCISTNYFTGQFPFHWQFSLLLCCLQRLSSYTHPNWFPPPPKKVILTFLLLSSIQVRECMHMWMSMQWKGSFKAIPEPKSFISAVKSISDRLFLSSHHLHTSSCIW